MLKASVIVCTRNRAELLSRCLDSVRAQTMDQADYELIVVDNGSTDGTPDVIRRFEGAFRNFKGIDEPLTGLSYARNTGARAAEGAIVAFLDDDAEAEPDWLAELTRPFRQLPYSPLAVGGLNLPKWELPRPGWLHEDLATSLMGRDHGREPKTLPPNQYIIGCSMAYRRSELIELGLFNVAFGFSGNKMIMNEETELLDRLRLAGGAVYYNPAARIRHFVPAGRLRKSHFYRRFFWRGVSAVLQRRMTGGRAEPRSAKAGWLSAALWDLKLSWLGPRDERVRHRCRLAELSGALAARFWRGWTP